MMFKRMMVLGAMASALALTGCQDRRQGEQDVGTGGAGDQSQQQVPATGGSGRTDTIPGSTDTIGGTPQDSQGTDLGGTGAQGGTLDNDNTGGAGSVDDQGAGSMDNDGTGGAGSMDDQGAGSMDNDGIRSPDDENIRQ